MRGVPGTDLGRFCEARASLTVDSRIPPRSYRRMLGDVPMNPPKCSSAACARLRSARLELAGVVAVLVLVSLLRTIWQVAPVEGAPLFDAPFLSFDTGNGPRSVAIGDLNGDGRPDLAVVNNGSEKVSVLLGNPHRTFPPQTDFRTGSGPICVATGDLNGDGRPELPRADNGSRTSAVP